jgi:Zn-dependent protease
MLVELLLKSPVIFLRVICIIIISICIHELAHGQAAIHQGDKTPQLTGHMTLNPVVHMGIPSLIFLCLTGMAWGAMPVNPDKFRHPKWGNILVSAAGPLANLGLAIAALLLLKWRMESESLQFLSSQFLYLIAYFNLMLFLFNMLPCPPLDGFYIFSEIFPGFKSLRSNPYSFLILALVFTAGMTKGLAFVAQGMIQAVLG